MATRDMERLKDSSSGEFQKLTKEFIATFIYHLITIQKVINILLTHHKTVISNLEKEIEGSINNTQNSGNEASTMASSQDRRISTARHPLVPNKNVTQSNADCYMP